MAQFANTSSDEQESGSWNIPFKDKKIITQILSRPTLIGGKQ